MASRLERFKDIVLAIALLLLLALMAGCAGSDDSTTVAGGGGGGGGTGGDGGGGAGGGGGGGGSPDWARQFGSDWYDGASAVAVDPAGNVFVVGNTWESIDGTTPNLDNTGQTADAFVAKYGADGVRQWVRQFGTSGDDRATGVATDESGNVVVVGFTFGTLPGKTNAGSSDYFVVKYTAAGAQSWAVQAGSPAADEAHAVATDRAGNVYVAGGTQGDLPGLTNLGGSDAFVASYDPAGSPRWGGAAMAIPYNAADRDVGRAVAVDRARGWLYVAGEATGLLGTDNVLSQFLFLSKFAVADGAPLASTGSYNNEGNYPNPTFGTAVAVGPDGNVYAGGFSIKRDKNFTSNAGDVVFEALRFDSSLAMIWHTYVPSGTHPGNELRGIAVDALGYVWLAGYASVDVAGAALGGNDGFVMQLDGETGATMWEDQFGTAENDRVFGVAVDATHTGNVYVVGDTGGAMDGNANLGGYDAFLAKY